MVDVFFKFVLEDTVQVPINASSLHKAIPVTTEATNVFKYELPINKKGINELAFTCQNSVNELARGFVILGASR